MTSGHHMTVEQAPAEEPEEERAAEDPLVEVDYF